MQWTEIDELERPERMEQYVLLPLQFIYDNSLYS